MLDVEVIGASTVVRFTSPASRDDSISYDLGRYLLSLAEGGAASIVLNLGAVDYLNSVMVGKFFALHKKVKALGGRLVLCQVVPPLYDLFALVKLPQLIPVVETEEEALAALETTPSPRLPRRVLEQPSEAAILVDSPPNGMPVPGWCASP
jgi:anti-sigma B factor antagonist